LHLNQDWHYHELKMKDSLELDWLKSLCLSQWKWRALNSCAHEITYFDYESDENHRLAERRRDHVYQTPWKGIICSERTHSRFEKHESWMFDGFQDVQECTK
jgi:hypothetical protein